MGAERIILQNCGFLREDQPVIQNYGKKAPALVP
jgi:hypothetical protein